MGRRWKKSPGHKKKSWIKLLFGLGLFCILMVLLFLKFEKAIMRSVFVAGEMQITTSINKVIDQSVQESIQSASLTFEDFFTSKVEDGGKVGTISANTVLINSLCSDIAVQISESLSHSDREKVRVPVGTVSGIDALANMGPNLSFAIMPVGAATVEYETVFDAAGINQVHFQIFLNVETTVRVVVPLQNNEIKVSRKITLVDTIITGEVPQNFYGSRTN